MGGTGLGLPHERGPGIAFLVVYIGGLLRPPAAPPYPPLPKLAMRRYGFTLIELLVVVVIVGGLAAIAIPKFGQTKDKTYVAAMKSDLHNLVTLEEAYYYHNAQYTGSLDDLEFTPSQGVRITSLVAVPGGKGWSATAEHPGSSVTCALFVGAATAPSPAAASEGIVGCQ
jgi:prepilin-type N-terminal cleavage/methylation domain-containing protein